MSDELPGDIATLQQTVAMLREIRRQDIEAINGLVAEKQRLQAELDAERTRTPPPQVLSVADAVPANEITDFLYKHGDLTYSAAARAVQLLSGNGYGFTNSSTARKGALLAMRKALNKIADMVDAEDGDLDDAISIARAAISASEVEG